MSNIGEVIAEALIQLGRKVSDLEQTSSQANMYMDDSVALDKENRDLKRVVENLKAERIREIDNSHKLKVRIDELEYQLNDAEELIEILLED